MITATDLLGTFPPWILLAFGFVGGWLKNFWDFLYNHTIGWGLNKIRIELTVEEFDHLEAFVWVNLWMEKHLRDRKISKLRLQRKNLNAYNYEDDSRQEKTLFELLPSYGFYYLWWNKKLLTFDSAKQDGPATTGKTTPVRRTISITVWGTRNRELLLDIILEAKKEYEESHPQQMRYYTHRSGWWDSSTLSERTMDTLYLPENQLQDLLGDFELFFASKEKYRSLGVPWRRGYLLEGPPGTGKSTVIQVLSGLFQVPIYYLNVGTVRDGDELRSLVSTVSPPCILLIEDVDSIRAAKTRTKKEDKEEVKGIQASDLLNVLDGLVATEQRIVIMTTNHPEKLDQALTRAGRVDRRFHFGWAEETELKKFYDRAAGEYSIPSYEMFRKSLPDNCTIADAQGEVFRLQSNTVVH